MDPEALPMFLRPPSSSPSSVAPPTPSQVAGTSARARLAHAEERPDSDEEEEEEEEKTPTTSTSATSSAVDPPVGVQLPLKTPVARLAAEDRRSALVRKGSRGQIADASSGLRTQPLPIPTTVVAAVAAAAALATTDTTTTATKFREGHKHHHRHLRRRSEEPEATLAEATQETGNAGETQSFDEDEAIAIAERKSSADMQQHSKQQHHHHHHGKHGHHHGKHHKRHGEHRRNKSSSLSPPLAQLVEAASMLPERLLLGVTPTPTPPPPLTTPPQPPPHTPSMDALAATVGASAAEIAAFASEWRGPRTSFAQYQVRRKKGGMLGRDTYEAVVDATGQPVLRARRKIKGGAAEYTITAGFGQQEQEVYTGTLRANMRKTEFVLSDGSHAVRCEVVYSPDKTADDPRGVRVLLSDDHCQTLLVNKQPEWSERMQSFVLDFNGRVRLPSIKNFQLARSGNSPDILFQFGRMTKTDFALDFKHPFTLLQAFAVAITAFN